MISSLVQAPGEGNFLFWAQLVGSKVKHPNFNSLLQDYFQNDPAQMYPAVPIKELTLLVNTAIIGSCDYISKHGFDWSA